MKTLEDFDWTFNPRVPRRLIQELSSGQFVHEKRDVLFVGPPGVGKTHLYVLVWRNAREKEAHYYAPYPGQISALDFVEFYKHPKTIFVSDLK